MFIKIVPLRFDRSHLIFPSSFRETILGDTFSVIYLFNHTLFPPCSANMSRQTAVLVCTTISMPRLPRNPHEQQLSVQLQSRQEVHSKVTIQPRLIFQLPPAIGAKRTKPVKLASIGFVESTSPATLASNFFAGRRNLPTLVWPLHRSANIVNGRPLGVNSRSLNDHRNLLDIIVR